MPPSVVRSRVLIASTPVGPLGSGIGGGVELTMHSLVYGLAELGHHVEIVAPSGSLHVGSKVHQVGGVLQASSQLADRDEPATVVAGSVLAAMWNRVADLQAEFDVIVNLAYDWLPLYLTPFMDTPVVHLVSMASVNDIMDQALADLARRCPGRLAAHSSAQASTFADADGGPIPFVIVGNGIVTDRYDVHLVADDPPHLGVVGRISPEKGLEDIAVVSERTGWPIRVWGLMQDPDYWQQILVEHPGARLEYCGFLPTDELQDAIGGCSALLMTPKWVEAFGNVAIEAMATGVPVVTYDRGGPAEIVIDEKTGFVVPADDLDALIDAVGRIDEIDRVMCRQVVEEHFSTGALATRFGALLGDVVAAGLEPGARARIISRFPSGPSQRGSSTSSWAIDADDITE